MKAEWFIVQVVPTFDYGLITELMHIVFIIAIQFQLT
jgi:hypothetical protein